MVQIWVRDKYLGSICFSGDVAAVATRDGLITSAASLSGQMIHGWLQFLFLFGTAATSVCVFIIIGILSSLACTLSSLRQREEVTFAFGTSVAVAAFQTILKLRGLAFFTVSSPIWLFFQIKGRCTSQCSLVVTAKTVGVIFTIVALVVNKAHAIGTFLTHGAIALYAILVVFFKTA